jgi:hypothetical protein
MHILKIILLLVNLIGGIGVIGSYIWGFRKQTAEALWGNVPQHWIPFYTAGMVLAAIGYFMFLYFFMTTKVNNNYILYIISLAVILIASAFWMPLTVAMLNNPSNLIWLFLRVTLAIVALASLALTIFLATTKPTPLIALIGSILFFLHVTVLDAIFWVYFFKS